MTWRLTDCAAAADAQGAEALEGDGEGDDVGCDVPDDHDGGRVGRDEFGRHAAVLLLFFPDEMMCRRVAELSEDGKS